MDKPKVYIKGNHEIVVSPKFVYCFSTYKIEKQRVCLLDEKYYASLKPLYLKKIPTVVKKKDYSIHRFINLESAPEKYLINNKYKQKQV